MAMFDAKYAEFIIPAFAITAVVFAGMVGFSLNLSHRWRKRYEALTRAETQDLP